MAKIYEDNSFAIGNTPLVKLKSVTKNAKATVLAKIEGRNPAYSVCLLYTSPSPRDATLSRMPSSA